MWVDGLDGSFYAFASLPAVPGSTQGVDPDTLPQKHRRQDCADEPRGPGDEHSLAAQVQATGRLRMRRVTHWSVSIHDVSSTN